MVALAGVACTTEEPVRFESLSGEQTGIDFVNRITVNDSFNALTYEYIYNGAGVGIGDLNGDGLPDVFLAGNQVSSRLYLNRGNLHFEDVTERSGVATERWSTGVSLTDVNGDGRMDIYVSVAGFGVPAEQRANLLFLNDGNDERGVPRFSEAARSTGLADTAYTSHTAFLDYDLDGDLDAYVLNNALEVHNRNVLRPIRTDGSAPSNDRLYRNEGDGTFTDVSRAAGITQEGYGLGVAVADINLDGWPDLYVANDFLSNDLVWINGGNGTFTDRAADYLPHTSHNGMGVDVADLNNDLLPDIMELDMLPISNYRQKMMIPYVNRDRFELKASHGYQDQYMRNTLQLHRGFGPEGEPRFTDVGNYAGVSATDWSWSVLLADYDLDGNKDIFVTNGYRKDITNLDFISYGPYNDMFGDEASKEIRVRDQLNAIAEVPLSNHLFRNEGNHQFTDRAGHWGLGELTYSTGAAYGDLDLDGDLDLVVNNIDQPASVLINRTRELTGAHYLAVRLEEDEPELHAYQTTVCVYAGGQTQMQTVAPFRGYLSSVDPTLLFGLGAGRLVDSVVIKWADGTSQVLHDTGIDTLLKISYEKKVIVRPTLAYLRPSLGAKTGFTATALPYRHAPVSYDDFRQTFTLPHGLSQSGPAVATADVDGDGRVDIVTGGSPGHPLVLLQPTDTGYTVQEIHPGGPAAVTDLLLFDADQDGDPDLYVVAGGTNLPPEATGYRDRFYRNEGGGQFRYEAITLPERSESGSCVRPADYDGDGDLDLFVGTRVTPGQYPYASASQLLRNDGSGFVDVTPPALRTAGMVSDARWVTTGTDDLQLIVATEWGSLRSYSYTSGGWSHKDLRMVDAAGLVIPAPDGWWFHLAATDADGDGDSDLVAGNLGLNGPLQASPARPLHLYAKDFDGNGDLDPLLFHYVRDTLVPFHERDLLLRQIPSMKRRFPDYTTYARAGLDEVLTAADREGSMHLQVTDFRSYYLENLGDGSFRACPLPAEAQLGPVRASVFFDLTGDGQAELILAGNMHQTEITQIGRYDGNYGTVLRQNEKKQWVAAPELQMGIDLSGEVSRLLVVEGDGRRQMLVGTYGDSLRILRRMPSPEILSR